MNILSLATSFRGWIYDTVWREQLALVEAARRNGDDVHLFGPGYDYWTNDVRLAVDKLVRTYQAAHNVDYETAFERVCADPVNDRVLRAYART